MRKTRVAVAMSGGVDSSVAAGLLVEQGYEVVGLTMQIWPREEPEEAQAERGQCCGLDAVDDARRVARTLGIRHHVLNLREQFREAVIEPFCDEYVSGRTPNPCIRCNTYIKFGALLRRAQQLEAEHLATGHYARAGYDEGRKRYVLWRAVDSSKDQSYTLYGLGQEQLARALFPLGGIAKSETRRRAADLGLSVSGKQESQQICFTLGGSYREYLMRSRPQAGQPGPIVDRKGRQVGRHRGVAFYTIGQRHGMRVAHGQPLYVVGIDVEGNRLIVGEECDLRAKGLLMRDVNYIALPALPEAGERLQAKIRYGASLAACTACPEGDGVRLEFPEPQRAVAPGQAAVCYDGDAVALGGTIESAL